MNAATFGDLLSAADEDLHAALTSGPGAAADLRAATGDLYRLVAVMAHCLADLAPCDPVEAASRTDLHPWEHAAVDAGAAMQMATNLLDRAIADLGGPPGG